ncbi:hypothetical protein [Entomobacter blattae]|uniref:Colicin V synthesis protein n=1 Tax=Entomobacter blattae TaxID=2762277 RepID=A0A7H1NTQ3_9PROT|nr:hypothetical protein [Entomobacter blattae]QNT79163.1 hypothetical protein JGUZn3_19510 [Entomobacter blattae]
MRELSVVELDIVSGAAAQNFFDSVIGGFVGGVVGSLVGSLKGANDTSKNAGPFGLGAITTGLGFVFGGVGGFLNGAVQGFTDGYSGINQNGGYIDNAIGDLTQGSLLS